MSFDKELFETVCATAREAALFQSSADALEWDERTGMPIHGGAYRAEQVARLRSSAHELKTDGRFGDALGQLVQQSETLEFHSDIASTIRNLYRDYQRDCKLPLDLVSRLSKATIRGQQVWESARRNDSFAEFKETLENVVALKREAGQLMADGTDLSAYEALLDEYEPDARIETLNPVFADLKQRLASLIARLKEAPKQPDVSILKRDFPIEAQKSLSRRIAADVGFDFDSGRLDETSHPFCTTLGPNDVRILSRYETNWFPGGLYGTLHEAGHGMYEQGLRGDWFGLPPGSYVSLGIHESQSRLWENQVGRGRSFCDWIFPTLNDTFPAAMAGVSQEDYYRAINAVNPSLIRVEADEATYNLHILIRFELEQAILSGDLPIADLPGAWNEQYRETLGIESPSDADGVLQDVHWSAGLIGYFPTYTLGNLAAAQLFDAATKQIDGLEQCFANGDFKPLLKWLRKYVHQHGACFSGNQLVENASGSPLSADYLMNYLENKLTPVFGLTS